VELERRPHVDQDDARIGTKPPAQGAEVVHDVAEVEETLGR